MKAHISLVLLSLLSGCSIVKRVDPVPEKLSTLCIEKNTDIFMDDYLGILEKELASLRVPTKTVEPSESPKCQDVLRYKANWKWDMAMYLQYANFSVFRGDNRIGYGEYSSAGGGLRPDKWGTTEDKIKPILAELFKNQR
jgi:hypothetical protein